MAFALLFLGLLPLMFLADFSSDSGDDGLSGADDGDDTVSGTTAGTQTDMLQSTFDDVDDATVQSGLTAEALALEPITDDEEPFDPEEIDPDTVLQPVTGDEAPITPDAVDPDTVLRPVNDPGDDAPAPGDATLLQGLLMSETDFDDGAGWLGDYGPETDDVQFGADEDHSENDDGISGTGLGSRTDFDGTPVVEDDLVRVIAGGDGSNTITLGDAAAYAFGGAGDDTIVAGEGAAALFGGTGQDTLTASDTGTWIDGGEGDDSITGGGGDDTLWGGAHSAGDDTVQDNDLIDGGAGDDEISGGYGADILIGGEGDDVVDHLGRVEEEYAVPGSYFAWHIDNSADVLDGGEGNDTLIMDRADTAIGGEGYDTFWVYFDGASGSGAATINDFTVGEDFLRISLNPELDHGSMELSVAQSGDGQDGVVSVNGEVVAVLQGTPNATAADVLVEISENIFV